MPCLDVRSFLAHHMFQIKWSKSKVQFEAVILFVRNDPSDPWDVSGYEYNVNSPVSRMLLPYFELFRSNGAYINRFTVPSSPPSSILGISPGRDQVQDAGIESKNKNKNKNNVNR
jgi:hypothetical protein